MTGRVTEVTDGDGLLAEVRQLREHVAELQQRIEQLDELAHQDVLMALPNRRGFMRELDRLVARAARYGTSAAMLFVDLDGLKMINDTFGHQAGDQALIQVAQLLSAGVRRGDIVGRLGGDEFGILLEQASEASAHETAARLGDVIAACDFLHDGDALPLSVAIGVAMIDGQASPAEVMAQADEEMYRRKAAA
jgi:diguanylate cyclase (GGDEF)-like protein